jgi:hypothetical protein
VNRRSIRNFLLFCHLGQIFGETTASGTKMSFSFTGGMVWYRFL